MSKRIFAALAAVCLTAAQATHAQETNAADPAAVEQVAVGTCAICHGPQGNSISPKFPVLAGQQPSYFVAQLEAFKSQTRGDPDAMGYMWGMAAPLSETMMHGLADYYGKQIPRAGAKGPASLMARGAEIYQKGDASKGIPACAACHGPHAGGNDTYPRLAGQHAQYLMKQLRSFQNNMRDVAVMHGVASGLKGNDVEAVAVYLQSLGNKGE